MNWLPATLKDTLIIPRIAIIGAVLNEDNVRYARTV